MNKNEEWQQSLCLLCGEFMGDFGRNTKDVTNFTGTSIEEILDSFIPLTLHHNQFTTSDSSICQNCFIKLNELDEHQMIAVRIKSDLLNAFNAIHQLSEYPQVKIKVEPEIDIPVFDDLNDLDFVPELSEPARKKRVKADDAKKVRKRGVRKPLDESIETKVENDVTLYQCKLCKKVMKNRGHAQQHVFIHKDIRNFCCQECGMTFKLKSHLKAHQKTHTGKVDKLFCDICGKKFDQKFYIREHMEAIHLDIRKFSCTICHMTFARKRCLNKHHRVHQDDSHKRVVCDICGFRTHSNYSLVRHSRTHTDERNFPCDICGKMFANSYNVTAHVNSVHKGIRPKVDESKLRCSICNRRFPRQRQLRRHLFEAHDMMEHAAEFSNEYSKVI